MMPKKGKKKKKCNQMGRKERALEKTFYPADFERADHVMDEKGKIYEKEREETFERMNELCGEKEGEGVSTEAQKKALEAWCVEYTDTNFPDIGEVAYAVPTFFVGKHDIKPDPKTLAFQHKQESDVRGEIAQAKVDRGLRLLNEEMERKKTPTMFIIDNVLYENVLIGLDDIQSQPDLGRKCPNLVVDEKGVKYYTRRDSTSKQRGEPDITIIHEKKGVIFVQVKAFGTHKDANGRKKKEEVCAQLVKDEEVFHHLFEHQRDSLNEKVSKVVALPNLSEKAVKKWCEIKAEDRITLLTKDNLFDDDMDCAESEYNLDKMRAWWDALPDHPISREILKDIVARFIGTLSQSRNLNSTTERTQARTTADAINLAGKMFKTRGLNLSPTEGEALTSCEYNRTHVQGPPGSGRTTMLILKAMNFLTSKKRHVVVLDIYRGLKGRPIGIQITNAIGDAENGHFKGRVHHLPVNLNEENEPFSQLVENLFSGGDKKPDWKEDLLFIVDEMLPLSYWSCIFEELRDKSKVGHVWCADGLVSQELDKALKFKPLKLECIYRLPASVQKVLFHADWDENRKRQYCSDLGEKQGDKRMETRSSAATQSREESGQSSPDPTPRLNVCTHGPTAVCIKHQRHDPNKALLNCVQCAEELKDVLIDKMKLVESGTHSSPKTSVVEEQAQAASLPPKSVGGHSPSEMEVDEDNDDQQMEVDEAGDSQGTVAEPSSFLPCSIVIVFSIPSNLYQGKDHVEINKEEYEDYVEKLNNSQFISTLRKALPVQLLPRTTEQNQDPESKDNWDTVVLSWVDIFQGLERDVVIFLPGETAIETEATAASNVPERKIPEPGLASNGQPVSRRTRAAGAVGTPSQDTKDVAAAATEKGMSSYYWRVRDIQRYTDWDKTSLMFAATRCTSQLIMLVP